MESRLKSRCVGLLELSPIDRGPGMNPVLIVNFIHRTAYKFLELPEVWDVILSRTKTTFDPSLRLLEAYILLMKVFNNLGNDFHYSESINASLFRSQSFLSPAPVSIVTTSSSAWRDQLLGIWKLLSVDLIKDEGQPIAQPTGSNPLGRLVSSPEGYASVLLTNPDLGREAFKDGVEWRQTTDTAAATVAKVATSYSGPFHFSTDAGTPTLIAKVEVSLDPNWIGTDQAREFSLREEGGKKILVLVPVKYMALPASLSLLKRLGI
jgi:hypothetical protein